MFVAADLINSGHGLASVRQSFYSTNGFLTHSTFVRLKHYLLPGNEGATNADGVLPGFPVILTTYHLMFASLLTQIMAHTTTMLDGRKSVKMTTDTYMRAIVPIGIFFSLSLICGNLTYLYLSVAFIQMLKVRAYLKFTIWMQFT